MASTVYFLNALDCPLGFFFLINILSSVFTHQKKKKKKKISDNEWIEDFVKS